MADITPDFTKKVLVDIEVKSEQLKKDLPAIIQEIDRLTASQKALTKDSKAGTAEFVNNAQQLRNLKAEVRDANKYIDNVTKAVHAETGSIQQNRAILSLTTADYVKLGQAEGATAASTVQLGANVAALTDKLKAQELEIKQTYRNVGNYTESINQSVLAQGKASHGIVTFTQGIADIRKGIGFLPQQIGGITSQFGLVGQVAQTAYNAVQTSVTGFNTVLKSHEDLQKEVTKVTGFLSDANNQLAEATAAVTVAQEAEAAGLGTLKEVEEAVTVQTEAQTVATAAQEAATIATTAATEAGSVAMGIFKVALASTGIGLLIIALASLVAYFSSTNEGAKKLQVVFAEFGATIETILKALAPLGKAIYDTFTNSEGPIRLIGGLLRGVVLPLATVVKLIGDIKNGEFKQAFSDAGEAIKQFGRNIKDEVQGAGETIIALGKNVGKAAGDINISTEQLKKNALAAGALKVQEQLLTKEERLWSEEKLKQQGVLDLLKLKIRDLSTTEQQRIKAAKDAKGISDSIYSNDLKHATESLKIIQGQQALKSKVDYQAITDAKNRIQQLTNAHNAEIQSIQNREARVESSAKKKAALEEKQRQKEADSKVEALQIEKESQARELQDIYESYGDKVIAADNEYNKEVTKLKKFLTDKLITQEVYNSVDAQLQKEHQANISKIIKEFNTQDAQRFQQAQNNLINLHNQSIDNDTQRTIAGIKQKNKEQNQEIKQFSDDTIKNINALNIEINQLTGAAQDEAKEHRDNEIVALQQNEAKRLELERQTAKEIAKVTRQAARDKLAAQDEADILKSKRNTNLFSNGDAQNAELKATTDKYNWDISEADRAGKATVLLEQQKIDAIKAINDKYRIEKVDFMLQAEQQIQSATFDIISQGIQQSSEHALNVLSKQKESELANSNLTATQKKLINDKYQKAEDAEKRKAFYANQKLQATNAIINGAVAVTKTISEMGFPLAIPFVALTAVLTGISVAKILSAKPGFAKGGMKDHKSDGRGALLSGYSRHDDTNAYLRSGEAVVVSEAMRVPWARNQVSRINEMFGGRSFSTSGPKPQFATGGIFTDGGNSNRYYSQPVYDSEGLANSLAYQLINNFPPIYTDVKDVNREQSILSKTVDRVNL